MSDQSDQLIATAAPVQQEEEDDSASSVIAAMAKARGGSQWVRSFATHIGAIMQANHAHESNMQLAGAKNVGPK